MYNLSKLIPFGLDDNGNTVLYIRDKYIDIDVTLDLSEVDSLKSIYNYDISSYSQKDFKEFGIRLGEVNYDGLTVFDLSI